MHFPPIAMHDRGLMNKHSLPYKRGQDEMTD